MTHDPKAPAPPAPPPPRCPHCDAEIASIGCYNWINPPWVILASYCLSCRKLLPVQMIPANIVAADTAPPAAAGPRLVS